MRDREELLDERRRREEEAERRARHAPADSEMRRVFDESFTPEANAEQQRRRGAVRSVLIRQAVDGQDRLTDAVLDEIIAAAETGI